MKPYLLCPNCGSDDIMRNGTTRRGKQNYKCRDCGRQFVENPQWKPKGQDTFALIDRLLLERIPLAGIARVLQLSESWLQQCHYERTLRDLPCVDFNLTLVLQVCKFFCDNSVCIRRIFTERIPDVAAPWARKTARLIQRLEAIGLALGGAAGARLAAQIGSGACGSTLLNYLEKLSLPPFEVPKILGVDEFAFRKGKQYGTILVDLERHQPIALLADRKAETLADWLRQHPGVEVLSRDRSATYRSAMEEGAPNAVQVADRFHLVQNLEETLEKVLHHYSAQLKAVERQFRQAATSAEAVVVVAKPTATGDAQAQVLANHQRRVQQDQEIKKLYQQNWTQVAIAQAVGVSERTVQRRLKLPELSVSPIRRSTFGRSMLDPYKQQLLEWWNGGVRQPAILMSLLKQQLLRQRNAEGFEAWLMKALKSTLKPFQAFAAGLFEDYAAVRASMMLEVSNGMVEGFNNRLKMVKRQMYGRAGSDLLSKRFILAQ